MPGNGCFWGRQKDFVDVERESLKRAPEQVSAVVGYAGGRQTGPDGRICYYYGPGAPHPKPSLHRHQQHLVRLRVVRKSAAHVPGFD